MATRVWRGDARPTAQVTKITPDTIESGDTFTLTINRKSITVTADEDGDLADAGQDTEVKLVADVVGRFLAAIGQYGSGTTTIPEFVELSAATEDLDQDGNADYLLLTGPIDGTPFTVTASSSDAGSKSVTVTTIRAGDAGTNEKQKITIPGTATSGTFTITFDGQTTGAIAYNASAATVETALEALSNIASGDVDVTGDAGGPWTIEFLQAYAAIDVPLLTTDCSSLDGNHTYEVETTTQGGTVNHIFDIAEVTGDEWDKITLHFYTPLNGVTTARNLIFNQTDSVASVQATIDADSDLAGYITVRTPTRTAASDETIIWEFEWVGGASGSWTPTGTGGVHMKIVAVSLAGIPQSTSSVNLTTVQDGSTSADEVQVLSILYGPTGGTFTLTFEGQTTGTIAYNASAATVETALEALSTIDGCTVAGDAGGPWTITYDGSSVAGRDVAAITATLTGLTGSDVYVAVTQSSAVAVNEQQLVELSSNATGGTFTLTWNPGGGNETTGNIAYNATASTVQTALEGLTTPTAGDFAVTGDAGGPWTVEFKGTYATTDVNAMTGDATNLTGAGSQDITVSSSVTPTGPEWISDANNWQTPGSSTATLPTTGDTIVFEDTDNSALYGLEDLNAETFAAVHVRSTFTGTIGLPRVNANDYFEYRPTAFQANMTSIVIGEGDGNGSARIFLDSQAAQTTLVVHTTGQSDDDEKAFIWKGTHASNSASILRGDVGLGTEIYGEAWQLATLNVGFKTDEEGDVDLELGVGCTALGAVVQQGGNVLFDSPSGVTVTSWTKYGGELRLQGEAAITTLLELEGSTFYESSGTATTVEIGTGGTVDCSRDMRSKTFTNLIMDAGSAYRDNARVVTLTNGIVLRNCGVSEVTIDTGSDIKLTVAAAP